MNALAFVVLRSAKNSLLELRRKPAKLILYLFVIAMIIGVFVISYFTKAHREQPVPMFWLTGILFLLFTLFVVIAFAKGLSGGDAIFDMSDVNLLFVSPVDSRKILLYGIVRMAKTAFWAGFFILFQSNTLAVFGVNFGGILLIFAGFFLNIVVLTTASLLIYSVTNGRASRKLPVKCLAVALFLPLVVFTVIQFANTPDALGALEAAARSPFLRYVPVAGWTSGGIVAFLTGEPLKGVFFFGLNLLLGAGMTSYILLTNPDYYEDVLVTTETVYEKKRAVAEGKISAASVSGRSVKVSKTGIPGFGAASLFGKHMRESFRQSRMGFLNMTSFIMIVCAVVAALIIGDLFAVLNILLWTQIFMIGTGRGLRELYSHYIYLIPESSFKKILWSNMEIMARTIIEGALIFGFGGILVGSNPALIAVCFTVYTLLSLLLLGVNYLFMRFTGADISAGILVAIYFVAVLLAMAPGLAAGIIVGVIVGGDLGTLAGLLALSGWELAAGLGCFALSKGVLHNCDMPAVKTGK